MMGSNDGFKKDSIPLRRRQALKIRAAVLVVVLLGAAAYYLGGGGGAGASEESNGQQQVPRRASSSSSSSSVSSSTSGISGDPDDQSSSYDAAHDGEDDAGHDDALSGSGGGGGGGGVSGGGSGGGAARVRPSMSVPEFAFAGTWAPSKATATIVEAQEASFACHASTLLHLRGGYVMMAWFGGTYEGAEDVAIWTAKRSPTGVWSPPTKAAKVHRSAPYNGGDTRLTRPFTSNFL